MPRPRVPARFVKSSIMVGVGETDDEVLETMRDLRAAGVDILTLGQYLRPTPKHAPVERYVPPTQFDDTRAWGAKWVSHSSLRVRSCAPVTTRPRASSKRGCVRRAPRPVPPTLRASPFPQPDLRSRKQMLRPRG